MMQYPMWVPRRKGFDEIYKRETQVAEIIFVSAFWLRSSVVYVLISLIFDTKLRKPNDINLIIFWCESTWQLVVKTLGIALLPK